MPDHPLMCRSPFCWRSALMTRTAFRAPHVHTGANCILRTPRWPAQQKETSRSGRGDTHRLMKDAWTARRLPPSRVSSRSRRICACSVTTAAAYARSNGRASSSKPVFVHSKQRSTVERGTREKNGSGNKGAARVLSTPLAIKMTSSFPLSKSRLRGSKCQVRFEV